MLKIKIEENKHSKMRILCLGAHSDDIEIGCGGTILKLLKSLKNSTIYWIVFSSNELREKETMDSADLFLKNAKKKKIMVKHFKDGFFPFSGDKIKIFFEQVKTEISPDIIFTHYRKDLHQDHRMVSDLTWNTFRDHLILEYEVAKYDGDLGNPNFYSHLDQTICQQKIQYLIRAFKSQHDNHWFDEESFLSLMRLRGIESNSPGRYSEAFYCRKMVL